MNRSFVQLSSRIAHKLEQRKRVLEQAKQSVRGYTPRQKLRACWADEVEPSKGTDYEASCVASKQ